MNEKNLTYLKDSLKYQGFGDKLQNELDHHIRQGFPEFTLKLNTEFNNRPIEALLHFRKGEQSDLYFFNKYVATLQKAQGTNESRTHTFYINKGSGVTLKEAFNLLEGRAVHKELKNVNGQEYKAWMQLDLKTKDEHNNYKVNKYHERYGFNLEEALQKINDKVPLKELTNSEWKERLLTSLEKGNLQSVKFILEDREQVAYLEANPQYKNLNIYDENGKKVYQGNTEGVKTNTTSYKNEVQEAKVGEAKEQKEEQKKEIKQEVKNTKEKKGVKQKGEEGLLEKKRTRKSKGQTMG